jgi:hypothetical protein
MHPALRGVQGGFILSYSQSEVHSLTPVTTREALNNVGRDHLIPPFKRTRRGAVTPPYSRESHVPSEHDSALRLPRSGDSSRSEYHSEGVKASKITPAR